MAEQDGSSRRVILAGAGAVGLTGVLAACGGSETPKDSAPTTGAPATGGPTGGSTSTPGSGSGGKALAKKSDIPVGGGKVFKDDLVVVTQPTAGEFKAFDAKCTHKGCPVSEIVNGKIKCNCHGSLFGLTDGAPTPETVKAGLATTPLAPKTVKTDGDSITLG